MEKETITQPDVDVQLLLSEILESKPEKIVVAGRKYCIGWLKRRTVRKFSHIQLKEKDPWKCNVKMCACILLNHRFGLITWFLLHFWYCIYWRWLYYVRDIDQVEIIGIFNASKKKIQSMPLMLATTLAAAMSDTMMMMARHEAGRAERAGEQPIH